ncbi:hypothetical protein ACFYS8_13905 [Kitasatospora sp. NPDC004615]|uniref:hypothetical protein n=1 Tax=Kitasatospora sp. NPDC004615 TaxID=3364017 RepID=UPI0036ABA27A
MSDEQELLATAPDARDITAELTAPPRRKLPWPTLALAGGLIAVLSFAGGVWYQKDNNTGGNGTARASGGQNPGQQNGGRRGQGGYGGQGGQNGPGGGGFTRGTVKSVDGTTVYLTDANGNTVKITTGDSTKVTTTKEGKVGDLQPGQNVTVMGSKGADGSYSATQLTEGGAGGFGGFGGFGGRGGGGGQGGGTAGTGSSTTG